MAKKSQKASIAHSRNFRHKPTPSNPSAKTILEPQLPPAAKTFNYGPATSGDLATNPIDVDWEYESVYERSINRENSETEYKPRSSESSDEQESDSESLDELSGDELEQISRQYKSHRRIPENVAILFD